MIEALPGDIFHRGQILNNTYEVEGVLGRGGTGEVYRARNLISGRIVAIKALNAQFSGQEGYIALMRREEQMRDIRDDAVVRYTECSKSDQGHVFLVMDYIDGPSIADAMLQRRLDPRELMIIAHRVAEGLVAAHKQGIVHRDLSPDNVILRGGAAEKATIIDFGIAKDTGAGARTIVGNDFAGKYEYAAPEQMEGKAEPRSDLYALGALLLAAWRGQVPFAGMTPGEMIRRKHEPLDTNGVPEPLKGLIEWLSAPSLAKRAPSAEAVVEQVGRALRGTPAKGGGERERTQIPPAGAPGMAKSAKRKSSGGGFLVVVLVLMLGIAGGGAWYAGLIDEILKPDLPIAAPYTLSASAAAAPVPALLTAHAPDEAAAQVIRAGFQGLAGSEALPETVTLAQGMPDPAWATGVAAVFAAAAGLEDWKIEVSDMAARVSGITPDATAGKEIRARLETWATTHGFTLSLALQTGPKILPLADVQKVLDERATCGLLAQHAAPPEGYPLGATIQITGHAADADLTADLQLGLRDVIGDRKLNITLVTLNPDLCAVRAVLPDVPNNAVSIWLGEGATGETNLTGVYGVGQNPVVEVLIPASFTEGRLWVMVVDNTGMVFNLLPNVNFAETDLAKLGVVENGMRKVRVLFSFDEFLADNRKIAMKINDGDFGKSEFLAFLTVSDLFDTRRPRDESITSFAEALAFAQQEHPGNIIGFASRILESRP
jgi:hypothetical protein